MTDTAIIYCRISRDRVGAGLGVQRQREDCEALAARLGLHVLDVYSDNDTSAYRLRKPRPDYQRLLADLKAGRASTVLAWHTDRLHRRNVELEEYIAVSEKHGILTHTVKTGPIDLSTPSGQMNARIVGAVAQFESAHKADRISRKKTQMAEDGEWRGGRRPFGYEADGVTLRPAEAAAIRWAAEAVLAGCAVMAVAATLNEEGITTSAGNQWDQRAITRMLIRARNAGLIEHVDDDGKSHIIGKANWPAILDEGVWTAVCATLTDPDRRTSPGPARRWLLSGIAECGVCEAAGTTNRLIVGSAGRGKGDDRSTVPAYKCRTGMKRKHVTRNAAHLDKFVTMHVIERMGRPDAAVLATGQRDDAAARARLVEREALRLREAEAAEMFADGTMTKAQVLRANTKIAKRRAELDEADAAAARITALSPFRDGDPQAVWDGLDLDRRRAVIRELMRVVVLPLLHTGRPKGWTPAYGQEWGYFDPSRVVVDWQL
ncbi:MAG TPA: recombinase family protein [Thermopolyspora sp.]